MAVVSVVQNVEVGLAVKEAIGLLGGIESFISPHDKVIIKPNLGFALPSDTGLTTDPRVVQAIVELCRRVKPLDVTVVEGSGAVDTKMAFERCGYSELARKYDVKLVDLNESQTTMVDVPDGKAFKVLGVPNIILESDVFISVPKFKLHRDGSWVTLSIKNLMGAIPGKGKFSRISGKFSLSREFWTPEGKFFLPHHQQWLEPRGEKKRVHTDLVEGLVDLNTVIKPNLTVIDGMVVCKNSDMKNPDPETLVLNMILASRDPLALDWIATKIGGLNPLDISYLKRAAERGIGESDYNQIQVVGTPMDKVARIWETGLVSL